jgi:hypothetical protein
MVMVVLVVLGCRKAQGDRNDEEGKAASPKAVPASDVKLLQAQPKAKTPVSKLAKLMKRSEASFRQKALARRF